MNANFWKGEPASFHNLNETERKAFEELNNQLISPPVMALPKPKGKYTIDTDACDEQVGYVLLQTQT